jgi:hypothetical protein
MAGQDTRGPRAPDNLIDSALDQLDFFLVVCGSFTEAMVAWKPLAMR